MLYQIYHGEILKDREKDWNSQKDGDPYSLLSNNEKSIKKIDWITFIGYANKNFRDPKNIDWGSFAWKCNKQELEKLVEDTNCIVEGIEELENNKDYGVVFIEEV